MDVLRKAQMLRAFADPNTPQETLEKWKKTVEGEPVEESYGNLEQISTEADGRKLEVSIMGEQRTYWVARDAAWVSGKGITIDEAYRVFKEGETGMEVKKVQNPAEIKAIKGAYMAQIKKIIEIDLC